MRLKRHLILAVAAIGLAGCALNGRVPISDWHLQHNEEIAIGERQMIVRNILRARDQESMVFTRVTQASGGMTRQARVTLSVFSGEGPGNATVTPGGQYQVETKPTWTIGVQHSQEFWRGIMRPIDIETVGHFVNQGWPIDIFTYLFVQSVLLSESNPSNSSQMPCLLVNDPDDRTTRSSTQIPRNGGYCAQTSSRPAEALLSTYELFLTDPDIGQGDSASTQQAAVLPASVGRGDFSDFEDWVVRTRRPGTAVYFCRRRAAEAHLPNPGASTVQIPHIISVVDHAGLTFDESGALQASGAGYDICIYDGNDPDFTGYYQLSGQLGDSRLENQSDETNRTGSNVTRLNCVHFHEVTNRENVCIQRELGQIQLRSLQRVIYYLGEGIRNPADNQFAVHRFREESGGDLNLQPITLFGLYEAGSAANSIPVRHHGETYYLRYQNRGDPRQLDQYGMPITWAPNTDYSQMVVTLLLQMVALHQSAEDAPTAINVRQIN